MCLRDWAAHLYEELMNPFLAGIMLTQILTNGGRGWIASRKQGPGRWSGCRIYLLCDNSDYEDWGLLWHLLTALERAIKEKVQFKALNSHLKV